MDAIVAVDAQWGIGKGGNLLCPIRADLKRFRALTLGRTIILGRKTLATFPGGRPLPGRPHLMLSRTFKEPTEGIQRFPDLETLLAAAPEDSIVIGGASVYAQLLAYCHQVYVTKIWKTFDADAFFPNLDAARDWTAAESGPLLEENGTRFQYVTYQRTTESPLFRVSA